MDLEVLLTDLAAESEDLDALLAPLPPERWRLATPAEGWTIAHQIGHLTWTDEAATTAATAPDEFDRAVEAAMGDPDGFVDRAAQEAAQLPPATLLERWRHGRRVLADALRAVPGGGRVPWFGPPMSATSMATARLMETWAHGQDVADALGVQRTPTDRLRHVAHIAVRARGFAYLVNGLDLPAEEVRVDLVGPGGDRWTWGPDHATQTITGPALDFCLLSTQRRHLADLDLRAEGDDARQWLSIAQAFAGPPGGGRPPHGGHRQDQLGT